MKYLLLFLCLTACDEAEVVKERQATIRAIPETLVYSKDPRTDLCFAITDSPYTQSHYIMTVPCTEAVLKLIVNK